MVLVCIFQSELVVRKPPILVILDLLNYDKHTVEDLSKSEIPIKRTNSLPTESEIALFQINLSQIAKKVPLD